MGKLFFFSIILILAQTSAFGQTSQTKDTSLINIRGGNGTDCTYYINGFRVYKNLTIKREREILKKFVSKLNGCWKLDSGSMTLSFRLSKKTFSGSWFLKGQISTAPLIRLEILNGQIKLISSDLIDGDGSQLNIDISDNILIIDYGNNLGTRKFKRQKSCSGKL